MPAGIFSNTVWLCLNGAQRRFTVGAPAARRYSRGLPAIIAFADPARPDFTAIEPECEPGEMFYCAYWDGPVPDGWILEEDARMLELEWSGGPAPPAPTADAVVPLAAADATAMVALAELTHPGPFGPRNLELGDYFGVFDGPRLIAMAGERMLDGQRREISAVCTHPDYSGRGHARRLMTHLIRHQLARGELPFLHVITGNPAASFYERLGFVPVQEVPVRIIRRTR